MVVHSSSCPKQYQWYGCTNTKCFLQVLVCRNYRGDVDMSEIEHFMTLLMDKEEEGTLSPILAHGGVRFMWIKHNNLYCILHILIVEFAPKQLVNSWYYVCFVLSLFHLNFLTHITPVVATSKKNASVSLVFSFLYKIVQVGLNANSYIAILINSTDKPYTLCPQ